MKTYKVKDIFLGQGIQVKAGVDGDKLNLDTAESKQLAILSDEDKAVYLDVVKDTGKAPVKTDEGPKPDPEAHIDETKAHDVEVKNAPAKAPTPELKPKAPVLQPKATVKAPAAKPKGK